MSPRLLSSFLCFLCFLGDSCSACSSTSTGTSESFLFLDFDLVLVSRVYFSLKSGLFNSESATKMASGLSKAVSIDFSVFYFENGTEVRLFYLFD
jgi:hypothetical protein